MSEINPFKHQYCTECHEVVEPGHLTEEHSDENGNLDLSVDVYQIHDHKDGYIAKDKNMGHFSPHHFMEIEGHDMCVECGAIKIDGS